MPIPESSTDLPALLAQLVAEQPTDFEVVLVTPPGIETRFPDSLMPVKTVASADSRRGVLLHAGALAAAGDVLLFLWPDNRLPREALLTIEKNLRLLPHTVGGNFHLTFDSDSWLARTAQNFIARQRYAGNYFGNSGIFVQRGVYHALGGFRPYTLLEDYDFGRRLEGYGPTLYLPDKIRASAQKLRQQPVKTAWLWGVVIGLVKVGVNPANIGPIAARLGGLRPGRKQN